MVPTVVKPKMRIVNGVMSTEMRTKMLVKVITDEIRIGNVPIINTNAMGGMRRTLTVNKLPKLFGVGINVMS